MPNENSTQKDYSIKLSTLGLIIVSIILGAISANFFNNQSKNEQINFSTIELISFVVSLLLSAASLVLAIMAINLGKSSEKVMLDRNDETFKLQNEVFAKTIEALSRIESSTGVTEKRIEDIISGRAGDIAERLVDDKVVNRRNKSVIQEEIKNSLLGEISADERKLQREKQAEKRKLTAEATSRYDKFKNDILLSLSNAENTKTLRIGEGVFTGDKEELLDGLFQFSNFKIGICTFSGEAILSERFLSQSMDEFINKLSLELTNKTFDKVLLIFDSETETTEHYKSALEKIKTLMKPEIADNIKMLIVVETEEIESKINSIIQ